MPLLLKRNGWSVQVPAVRAAERDEEGIAARKDEQWPIIEGQRELDAHICFEDEAGSVPWPPKVRT